ncbi:MAG: GspH/FimT family pseudopilin [Defluviitaleaceae bacterium]|nr:GspH/FimT family pseudopilin [Defluviitaleaceae bacterium]
MKQQRGFTLMELVIVMAVLMVVVGVILVSVNGNSNDYRVLSNAAVTMQADIRYAQRRAIMEGRRIGVHFDVLYNRYHIIDRHSTVLRTVYLPDGVNLLAVNYDNQRLMYLPRGTASQAGTIALRKGRYHQEITTTVSGGQVRIHDIIVIN